MLRLKLHKYALSGIYFITLFNVLQIVFWFFSGVSESLADDLEDLGVSVKGRRIPDEELGIPDFTVEDSDSDCEGLSDESEDDSEISGETLGNAKKITVEGELSDVTSVSDNNKRTTNCSCQQSACSCERRHSDESQCVPKSNNNCEKTQSCAVASSLPDSAECVEVPDARKDIEIKKLNLDVTAIIAYVSATTNGGANFIFSDKVLTEQAMWERSNPVKKTLDQFFEGNA